MTNLLFCLSQVAIKYMRSDSVGYAKDFERFFFLILFFISARLRSSTRSLGSP